MATGFQIIEIARDTYRILDADEDSFYLVVGDERAALIDTGVTPGVQIRPMLAEITDKPIVLVLTHAHVDHFHHMDEFDTVYMSHEEFHMPTDMLREMMMGKTLDLAGTIDIHTDDIIDLGGEQLEICRVPGHTPGTVVVLAKQRNILFTGDAIGSGYGVWMQVPGALPLEDYYESLRQLMRWLVLRGGRMTFHGGHDLQQYQSTLVRNYNPLGMGLLADLIDLVDGILRGEIVGHLSNEAQSFGMEPAYYASFGRAEIQYLRSRIRRG